MKDAKVHYKELAGQGLTNFFDLSANFVTFKF